MEKSTQDIVSILETAKKKIENLNVNIENSQFKSRAISDISKTITALKIVATSGEAPSGEADNELPKVKMMFGRRIDESHQPAPTPPPVTDIQEEEMKSRKEQQRNNELDIFIQRIDSIYPGFNNMTNEEIFNSLSDMEIRGVARKAGLSFTETDPKIITTGAIAEIREAIEKRAEIDSQVSAAKESLKETDTVQKPAATDTVTTVVSPEAEYARSLLEKLYREQPSELADMADEDKCFYVKNHIYDGYGEWLISGTKNTASYKSDSEELQARSLRLYYYGIQVIPKETDVITEGSDAILTVREDKTKGAEAGNDKEGNKEAPNAKKKPGK